MSFCTFADGAAMFDVTPIENMFLMEHMYDAPAAALKVYLYARMLALHPEMGGSLSDMAKALRMEEGEVEAAFDYWERRELVVRVRDNPPAYAFQSMRYSAPAAGGLLEREMYANRDFNNALCRLFGDQFIGDHELRKAADWNSILKMDKEAILRLVEYGIRTSRPMMNKPPKMPKPASVFRRLDKIAEEWSSRGIRTLSEVERAIDDQEYITPTIAKVMKKMGITRAPSEPEYAYMRKWVNDWGYTQEEILRFCDETVNARNPSFGYLNGILENRRYQNPAVYRELSEVLKELNPLSSVPAPDTVRRYEALKAMDIPSELILQAAIQCHRANKFRFDDLEWRLSVWREEGIDTAEAAEEWMRQTTALSRELRQLYRAAGFDDKRPGYRDITAYREWKAKYPEALIQFAAECSRNAGGSTAYMEKLLAAWAAQGVTTMEAARAQREAFRAVAPARTEKPANPALDYTQREYKDEDFGDDFYFDYDREFGNKEDKA